MAEQDLRENPFRDEIYTYLLDHGYCAGERSDYDYAHALDTGKLFAFLEATQPEELNKLKATYGEHISRDTSICFARKSKTVGF